MMNNRWLAGIMSILFSALMVFTVGAAPHITAKDGILYQDGKPGFLVGAWGHSGYDGANLHVNYGACKGYVESVPGRKGSGLKIIFEQTDKPNSRWIDTGFFPPDWAQKKYKCLKIWVKGDGSRITLRPAVGLWLSKENRYGVAPVSLGNFIIENAEWQEITVPLEGKYDALQKANECSIGCGKTNQAFSLIIDEITAIGPDSEELLCDFDGHGWATSHIWDKWEDRDKFKDDPVYQALRDDPLYQEISRKNFEAIGMNTYHLGERHDVGEPGIIAKGKGMIGNFGEVVFCEKADGMPIVPGFIFAWGAYYGGKQAENWANSWHLPLSFLHRYPNGTLAGGMASVCFEDPLGSKIAQTIWQGEARHLLSHGANIYAYELINENSGYYACGCSYNQEAFIKRLQDQYGDIASLNKDWGTAYQSFDEIKQQIPKLGSGSNFIKGLTVAWIKFLEDRYVELLQQGGEWIHEVEDELGRPHALMGQMGDPLWDFYGPHGGYMYKMAKGLDVIETEGGVGFGSGQYSGEVNPLLAVIAGKGKYGHQIALDLADAACPDKPIINTENYIIRWKGGREPTTKGDIITSLWEEFIRGASASHTYQWAVLYANREAAIAEGLRNQQLLSPYIYPRESLHGYKEVQEEIERVADIVMPRPRLGRNAELAILFSRPTARYLIGAPLWRAEWKKESKFYRSHEAFYNYLLENHHPMRFVYEEQLPEGRADKYRVMLVPHSDNIYPETIDCLARYANAGGTLVCFGDAFRYDEYGNEKEKERKSLLGVERQTVAEFSEEIDFKEGAKVKVSADRKIMPDKAETVMSFPQSKEPFITLNKVGKGKVYYVNADAFNLDAEEISPLLDYLCALANLDAPVKVTEPEGNKAAAIEANLIPGGNGKAVLFMVNWKPYQDRAVKVRLTGMDEATDYQLRDIGQKAIYTRQGNDLIAGRDLREGIYLMLPAQERVVLLLSEERHPLLKKLMGIMKGPKEQSADKKMELLDANKARDMNARNSARLKAELEKEAAEAARKKEIVFCVIEGNTDRITEWVRSAAGDAIEDAVLKSSNSSCDVRKYGLREGADRVLTFVLVFKETTKAGDREKALVKVLNALVGKYGDKVKIISGWKGADILKALEYKKTGACKPRDIRKQVNMGFTDEKPGDQKGGLFDEGRSLKGMPLGSNVFTGIVFDVIDPAKNNGLACIVLKGQAKPYFTEKAEGIVVGGKAQNIYLLQGACYCFKDSNETVYRLKFNYADGTEALADIRAGKEITDWFNEGRDVLVNARPGWKGKAVEKNGNGGAEKEYGACLYCAKIANPHPDKEISTLDLISANNKAVPAVFGITVEE